MRKVKVKQNFAKRLKEEFDFDVSAIGSYVDEQSTEIIEELVLGGNLVSRVNVMEGVKGAEKVKLMKMDTPLQSAEACGRTPDGDIIFTDKTMTVAPVKIDMAVCNKTLKGAWTQMLLALGLRNEKSKMVLEDVISATVVKKGQKKNQELMFKGDTASANPDLVFYDGLVKLWKADASVVSVPFVGANSITNAFARYVTLAQSAKDELWANDIAPEIITARKEVEMILTNIYNDKDYNALIDVKREKGEMSFLLPTTGITVRSYPELKAASGGGTGANAADAFLVPYNFIFFGTDLEGDIDDFWLYYDEKDEKLYFGSEWASGVQYVYPEYFSKMVLS
jgi:hypothetical protein